MVVFTTVCTSCKKRVSWWRNVSKIQLFQWHDLTLLPGERQVMHVDQARKMGCSGKPPDIPGTPFKTL